MITAALARIEDEEAGGGPARLLVQMQVVPFHTFVEHGTVPRRSCHEKGKVLHMPAASLPDHAKVIFISQRWLRRHHPDDEQGTKHRCLRVAAEAWASAQGTAIEDVY